MSSADTDAEADPPPDGTTTNTTTKLSDSYDYLIVGGGVVSYSAAKAIHQQDPEASIAVIGADPSPAVYRPDLSKKLWTDPTFDFDQIWLHTHADSGADVATGTTVVSIDPAQRTVTTDTGQTIGYRVLLLATGGQPRELEGLPPGERVIYYRTVGDYRHLRALTGAGTTAIVVGGGYIGSEVAAGLALTDTDVTLVFPAEHLLGNMFPADIVARIEAQFTAHGVTLVPGTRVTGGAVRRDPAAEGGETVLLNTDTGKQLSADVVVLGLGISVDDELAADAGLSVDNGVVVDADLRTSDQNIYAAGDVANYPDKLLGRRRVEHVDNAEAMGNRAGENMAGDVAPYDYTPLFFSDLFDDGYEAVGRLDSSLTMVQNWNGEHSAAVVYYAETAQDDLLRVVGVLLWNIFGKTDQARAVIADTAEKPVAASELDGRIDPAS